MNLEQIDVTGCRLVGAVNKELGHAGPKHHGVILGRSMFGGDIYIAELMDTGYQVCTYKHFHDRYSPNAEIRLEPNEGPHQNLQVAQRALDELRCGGQQYDLISNNCESFVNRAMHGKSTSQQVINTALGVVFLVAAVYVLKNSK